MQPSARVRGNSALFFTAFRPDGAGLNDPKWCKRVSPVSAAVLKQNFCATPSAGLMQYEWAKHGSCVESDAERYFAAANRQYTRLRFPDMEALSRSQTDVGTFTTAFVAANPGRSLPTCLRGGHHNSGLVEGSTIVPWQGLQSCQLSARYQWRRCRYGYFEFGQPVDLAIYDGRAGMVSVKMPLDDPEVARVRSKKKSWHRAHKGNSRRAEHQSRMLPAIRTRVDFGMPRLRASQAR